MVTEAEARRTRPFMSGVVALAVALAATMIWYYMGKPDETPHKVRTVDWAAVVEAGRADDKLAIYAPDKLPLGWRATSASYDVRREPTFSLGFLVEEEKFVGVAETRAPASDLVEENIDADASEGDSVTIGGVQWRTWTDAGGDYGVTREVEGPQGTETVLVYGSVADAEIRDFAADLKPRG